MNPTTIISLLLFYIGQQLFRKRRIKCHLVLTQDNQKQYLHTSFPKNWDAEKIQRKISAAKLNPLEKNEHKIVGMTRDRLIIQIYIKNDEIVHEFPHKLYNPIG